MLILPVTSLPAHSFKINLDGFTYKLEFVWNSLHDFWAMNIFNIQDQVLIRGVKLIINYELIRRYARADLPPGAIIPLDTTNQLERVGENDLGAGVSLIYITEAEFNGIV